MTTRTRYVMPGSPAIAKRELAKLAAREFEVTLPFPPSELMQNRREGHHWRYAHQAKVAQRQGAYLLARQAIISSGFEPHSGAFYRVEMDFHTPDGKRRDTANMHAAMKAAIDGIAEAMGVDDYYFRDGEQKRLETGLGKVVVAIREIR